MACGLIVHIEEYSDTREYDKRAKLDPTSSAFSCGIAFLLSATVSPIVAPNSTMTEAKTMTDAELVAMMQDYAYVTSKCVSNVF